MASSQQTILLPEPEVESQEAARPLREPERKETPFVIRAITAIPV